MSWILVIFCACVSLSEPPNTVKSLAKTNTVRPLTVPQPVTTPSPGILVSAMPKSSQRCSTNMSNSSNESVIEEEFDALARGQLALGVLRGDALLAAAETGALAASVEAGEHLFHQWLRNLKPLSAQRSTTSRSLEWVAYASTGAEVRAPRAQARCSCSPVSSARASGACDWIGARSPPPADGKKGWIIWPSTLCGKGWSIP